MDWERGDKQYKTSVISKWEGAPGFVVTREIFNSILKKEKRDFFISAVMAGFSEDKGGWK